MKIKQALSATRFLLCALICGACLTQLPEAYAQSSTLQGQLSVGGRVTIRGTSRCTIELVRSSTVKRTRVRCTGTRVPGARIGRSPGLVTLNAGQKAIFTARSCFLRARLGTNRVNLACVKNRPASTPTPTPTSTATPEITATITPTPTINANAAISGNQLLALNVDNPAGAGTPVAMTGVTAGDEIVALDRRPQNGFLYGLGYNATNRTLQLYGISSDTNTATAIGSSGTFVQSDGSTPAPIGAGAGTRIDMDFNPAADRIRVVVSDNGSGTGQTFRMNPNTGAFVDGDLGGASGSVTGLNMDGPINTGTTSVQGAAYTNSSANTTVTTLYTLDAASDKLCIQTPPNSGTQALCQALNQGIDTVIGFDMLPEVTVGTSNTAVGSGSAKAIVRFAGSTAENMVSVDLTNGAISNNSPVGASLTQLLSFAIQKPAATNIVALSAAGDSLVRFSSATPGTTSTAAITGINAGETLVGIDYRPATGQLYGLGINAGADTGTVYVIDPQSGASTAVGAPGQVAFVDGSATPIDFPAASEGYGFDFNPTVDRIRVVTGNGANFRLNPITGAPVDSDGGVSGTNPDGSINGATVDVDGAAYTNSSAGQTVTTLYIIDADSDALYIQNPPNNGTQTSQTPILLSGSSLNFTEANGFDIPFNVRVTASNTAVTSGTAFAALAVGGTTGLYSINLVTGAATSLGTIGTGTSLAGIAVSQGTVN